MAQPSPNGSNGETRDARGRFGRGNSGGPGNPYARRVAALRTALANSVSPEALTEMAQALVERAKSGDVAAAKLVLGYLIGAPLPAIDPDHLDSHENEVRNARASSATGARLAEMSAEIL